MIVSTLFCSSHGNVAVFTPDAENEAPSRTSIDTAENLVTLSNVAFPQLSIEVIDNLVVHPNAATPAQLPIEVVDSSDADDLNM